MREQLGIVERELVPGDRLGDFQIVELLARGGMAEVHLARCHTPGHEGLVVIKRLHPHLARSDEWVSMLIDEANIGARLDHDVIASVRQVADFGGVLCLIMDYVDGVDLLKIFNKCRRERALMPLHHTLRVVAAAARALDYVHHLPDHRGRPLGIVHRDISLSNIMVTYDGKTKLIDFGVATGRERLTDTQAGVLKGKTRYMSPEQVRGRGVDGRSDVFSLGIVLWELTTGRPLFRGRDALDCMRRVVKQTIPPPSSRTRNYPRELERIVMRALARDVTRRYQSAGELAADLEAVARTCVHKSCERGLGVYVTGMFPEGRRVRAVARPAYEFGALARVRAPEPLDWCPDTTEVSAFLNSALDQVRPGGVL